MVGQIRIPSIAGQVDFTVTLPSNEDVSGSWTENAQTGFFEQTVSLVGMQSSTMFFVDIDVSGAQDTEEADALIAEWAKVVRTEGLQNQIKFYCSSEPELAITIRIRVVGLMNGSGLPSASGVSF